jgi:hypothetical protein
MTIEEMKRNLNRGVSEAELLRDFQRNLKEAREQVTAERVKADTIANARKQLATSICSYAKALYGTDADAAEVIVMLKEFENDTKSLDSIANAMRAKCNYKCNKTKSRKTESDDDIIQAFLELFS